MTLPRNVFQQTAEALAVLLLFSAFVIPRSLWARKGLPLNGQIELIRGLDYDIAVTKVPLPLGKHGIIINEKGQIDHQRAKSELIANGTGVAAGMPAEITKMTFKPSEIIFDINGGGRKREKWYQHIQVGIGDATQPIVQRSGDRVTAEGSFITLKFRQGVPTDLTVEQAKHLLAAALDFDRQSPTVLYSPSVPPKFKDAIKKHEVVVGMDRDEVLAAKGPPDRKVRSINKDGEVTKDDWIYGLPPHVLFVTFEGETVVKVHQY